MRHRPLLALALAGALTLGQQAARAAADPSPDPSSDPATDPTVEPDDTHALRTGLDRVLAVLRPNGQMASRACLDAMTRVHATEQQVKYQLQHLKKTASSDSDPLPNPDLDVARDVLGSDYETATHVCGADADRICAAGHASDAAACAARGSAGTSPG